jgi:hypothetical protein
LIEKGKWEVNKNIWRTFLKILYTLAKVIERDWVVREFWKNDKLKENNGVGREEPNWSLGLKTRLLLVSFQVDLVKRICWQVGDWWEKMIWRLYAEQT